MLRGSSRCNPVPLPDAALARLFTEIMSACRALEDALTVAYLGPQGTFSQEAALKHFGGTRGHWSRAPRSTRCSGRWRPGRPATAVVPVENSTEGAIGRTLDLLLATPSKICGEVMLPVHQCLMSRESKLSGIRKVYSHTQSLAQCQQWLARALPQAERVAVVSNAEAARLAARERRAAAIGPKTAAALYRLESARAQHRGRSEKHHPLPGDRGARCGAFRPRQDIARHVDAQRAGRDARAADAARGEQREHEPARIAAVAHRLWEYVFYVDIEGHQQDAHVRGRSRRSGRKRRS